MNFRREKRSEPERGPAFAPDRSPGPGDDEDSLPGDPGRPIASMPAAGAGGASAEAGGSSGAETEHGSAGGEHRQSANMLPGRERRRFGVERALTRLVATCGVIGIGVVIAAIMTASKSQGWVIGLVVAVVSVVLSAILWSSRQL